MTLIEILRMTMNKETSEFALTQLDEFKQKSENYLLDVLKVVLDQNVENSFIGAVQLQYILKQYRYCNQTYQAPFIQMLIENFDNIPIVSKMHIIKQISIAASESYYANQLPGYVDKIVQLIESDQSNLIPCAQLIDKLYNSYNFQITMRPEFQSPTRQLALDVIDKTQQIIVDLVEFAQQQDQDIQFKLLSNCFSVFNEWYRQKDISEFQSQQLPYIMQQAINILQNTGVGIKESEMDAIIVDFLRILVECQFELIEANFDDIINLQLQYIKCKNFSTNKHVISQILNDIFRYFLMSGTPFNLKIQGLVQPIIQVCIPLLQFTDDDMKYVDDFDVTFAESYINNDEINSCMSSTVRLLTFLAPREESVLQQLQSFIEANYQTNLLQVLPVFKVTVMRNYQFGELRDDWCEQAVQQFAPNVINSFKDINSLNQLHQCELIKFCVDFYQHLSSDQALDFVKFLLCFVEQSYESPFLCLFLANSLSKIFKDDLKNNTLNAETATSFVQALSKMNIQFNFQNQVVCDALCKAIQKSQNIEFFNNIKTVLYGMLQAQIVQQSVASICNVFMEMFSIIPYDEQVTVVQEIQQICSQLSPHQFEDSMCFILQILAYTSRFAKTPYHEMLFNACLTQKNHDDYELTKPMIIYIINYMKHGFEDSQFIQYDLRLLENETTTISQSIQLINLLSNLIQNNKQTASAYELLNFLVNNEYQFDEEFLDNVIKHTMDIRNDMSFFRMELLNMQATLFIANVIVKYGLQRIVNLDFNEMRIHGFLSYSNWSLSYSESPKKNLIHALMMLINDENKVRIMYQLETLTRGFKFDMKFRDQKQETATNIPELLYVQDYNKETEDIKEIEKEVLKALGIDKWPGMQFGLFAQQ